jgi:hypothetical protein
MQRLAFADLERADQRQPQEILVKPPRLLRISAAIGIVVQPFDLVLPAVSEPYDIAGGRALSPAPWLNMITVARS